jgi:hypothetical protein
MRLGPESMNGPSQGPLSVARRLRHTLDGGQLGPGARNRPDGLKDAPRRVWVQHYSEALARDSEA